jgi:hypothetical protein
VTDLITNLVTQGYSIYEAVKGGVPQTSTKLFEVPVGNGAVPVVTGDQNPAET